MTNENQLEDLKKKLYRLHFLLTEKEDAISIQESLKQFQICFKGAMLELSNFLFSEHGVSPKDNFEILELSLEYKLFNQHMTELLGTMVGDFNQLVSGKNTEQVYNKIKENYAGNLQIIHDMLTRMGQDVEED